MTPFGIRRRIRSLARGLLDRDSASAPAPVAPSEPLTARPPPPDEPEEERIEVESDDLSAWVREGRAFKLLDIREPYELRSGHLDGSMLIPMNQVPQRLAELPRDGDLVVVCAAGARSYGVAHYLREHGFPGAWSLVGGAGAWAAEGGWKVPHPEAPFALLAAVRVAAAAARARGLDVGDEGVAGTVQAADRAAGAWSFAVQVLDGNGRAHRLEGLGHDDLAPAVRGGTGA